MSHKHIIIMFHSLTFHSNHQRSSTKGNLFSPKIIIIASCLSFLFSCDILYYCIAECFACDGESKSLVGDILWISAEGNIMDENVEEVD